MQCTIEELQLLVETQQCEMDAQRKEIDLLKMSGAFFPPLSSSSSGSMCASRRQCSLYSNIVSKDPMVNKVSDRLALASDLMEIEKKNLVLSDNSSMCSNFNPDEPILLSDHLSINFNLNLSDANTTSSKAPAILERLLYRKCDFKALNQALLRFNWPKQLSYFSNCDSKVHFLRVFNEFIESFTPKSNCFRRSPSLFSSSHKSVLKHLKRNNKNWTTTKLQKPAKRCIKLARKNNQRLEDSLIESTNTRKLFQFIGSRTVPHSSISPLTVDDATLEDPAHIANEFIRTFYKSFTARVSPFPVFPLPFSTHIDLSLFSISQSIKKLSPKIGYIRLTT
uniref:Uncharacterized protein n=1 Tax=Caenorhabditis japonica TaxID=281687 RepID=A0A8R1HPK0_CAEJA